MWNKKRQFIKWLSYSTKLTVKLCQGEKDPSTAHRVEEKKWTKI